MLNDVSYSFIGQRQDFVLTDYVFTSYVRFCVRDVTSTIFRVSDKYLVSEFHM